MADVQSNIHVNIDTSEALASIKLLQKQISAFHSSMAKSGAAAAAVSANMQQNLVNSLNATGKWSASMRTVKTTTESFTNALEKNKLSMREYFRYSAGATRTFGRFFKSEFDTINKVARERVKDLQTQYIKMGRDANGAMKAIAVRPLALDMKNLGTQTAMAAQRQALLNQLLKQGSTNMLNFGKNTQWAGRQLMVGFTVPLAYLGTAAAKTFMKLEEQAIRFKRVYGELFTTGQETDKMLAEIQLLAKEFTKYGVAVEKTMEMAATAAASGKMGAELLAQVNEATRLAVLGGVEQEQALETTISLTNAFGLAAEELAGKINFLNAVENQTVVSIEDLTVAIPKAGPVVKQLGGDVEDLAFFLTAMKEGGINASEGANALKSGLASLINPTDKASKMLAGMGVNIKGIVEANKGDVKGVVIDFANALNTLDPLNRARAIEQLFGKFQFSRLSTLFQNVIQQGNQANRVLTLTQATTEELAILSERELARVEESTTYKFKKAIEDLKVTLAPVGEEFLKAITPVAEFVGKMLEKFNNLGDGTKKFVVILTTLLGGIGPIFLMSFGLLANGLANIIKLFVSMKSVFNRAGQSSTVLGNQTQFLTAEQAQAAAVASSLDQVHVKLQQTFTSETAALNVLTQAYQRAISAQRGFGGGIIGKGRKGFATGTTGVKPYYFAKGTDTVPAMLTPGEAVIPAGPAQHPANKPAIAYMVAGGILGQHAEGITEVTKKSRMLPSMFGGQERLLAPYTMFAPGNKAGGFGMDPNFLNTSGFAQSLRNTAAVAGGIEANIRLTDKAIIELATEVTPYTDQITQHLRVAAREFAESGQSATHISQLFDRKEAEIQGVLNRLSATGPRGAAMATGLRSFAYASDKDIRTGGNVRVPAATIDPQTGKVVRSTQYSTRTGKAQRFQNAIARAARVLPISGSGVMTRAHVVPESRVLLGNQAPIRGSAMRLPDDIKRAGLAEIQRKSQVTAQRVMSQYETQTSAAITTGLKNLVNQLETGIKKELKSASPSRRMKKVGQDAGRGLVLGAQEYVDDAKAAGQKIGGAATQGIISQSQMAAASRRNLYGTGPIDPAQKSLRRQLDKQAKLDQIAQKRMFTQSNITGMVAGGAAGGGGNRGRGGFFGRFRRPPADPDNPKRGMGAGGIAMGLSMAAMAGSMAPGKVGEVSQNLMMPLMVLSMLTMMPAKIAGVIAALGALTYAIVSTRMAFDKAQDASMQLTETTQASSKAITDLSKFAGTVSAGEVMRRRREKSLSPFEVQTGKTTFGESFVKSETGKAMLSGVGKNIKAVGKKQAQSDLTNQLVTGVISGSLTPAQARSIAGNIGKELGDYGFGIQVNAKLIELLGPNGENLIKDPLAIRVKMIEETRSRMGLAASSAGEAGRFRGRRRENLLGVSDMTQAIGGTLAGAGAGAAIGAAIGSAILPGIGTAVGAVLGTGVGAVAGNFFARKERMRRVGEASGASVAMSKIALEQQQEMVDSLDLEYEKKIANAKAAGNQAEAERLTNEYIKNRNGLLAENQKTVQQIQTQFAQSEGATRKALMTGAN